MNTSSPVLPPAISSRRRMLILAICCLSLLIVGMDVNLALPAIRADLQASSHPGSAGWSPSGCCRPSVARC